jgi:hypothetical protein
VDDVGHLVEHHEGLPAATLAEGVHRLAQTIQLISVEGYLALLDPPESVLRHLDGTLIGGRRQCIPEGASATRWRCSLAGLSERARA